MDINLIKNKLEDLQQVKKVKRTKEDYEKIYWSPKVGKHQIRVVPSKFDSQNPFMEAYFYYGIGNNMMISPSNFGEPDPIKLFIKKLRSSNERENWSLAKKLEAKLRIFAPVIVRGEEDKGVRWWQFGKNMYLEFLKMAEDEDIGDFTDVNDGRDFTIDTVGPETTGTPYNKSSLRPKTKTTPLSTDPAKVKEWMENQPNPLDVYTKYTFEQMKENLQAWLEPDSNEEETLDTTDTSLPKEEEPKVYTPPTTSKFNPKKTKLDEFKTMFDGSSDDSDSDDLPF
jgi:hypothetical protein